MYELSLILQILLIITLYIYLFIYFGFLTGICTLSTENSLRLFNPYGNSNTDGGMLQVCKSSVWKAVCDYSFDCTTEGRAACKQLGYGGAHMSEIVIDP